VRSSSNTAKTKTRVGVGGMVEKWPKQCMHMWINELKTKQQKSLGTARHLWLMPVLLATQKPEMRKIVVWRHPGQIVRETLSQKNPTTKKGWYNGSRCRPWVQTPIPKTPQKLGDIVWFELDIEVHKMERRLKPVHLRKCTVVNGPGFLLPQRSKAPRNHEETLRTTLETPGLGITPQIC
jgi:hypothetical protein